MKAKKLLLFLFYCLLISAGTQATNVDVSFSEPLKATKKAVILNSGQIGDKIYAIKHDKSEYSMLIYDSNLKFLKETLFKKRNCKEGDCIDGHFDYKRTLFFEDRILVLFQTFEKSTKNRLLLCQTFDLNGDFVGNLTIIDNIPASKKSNSGSFHIEHSKDKSKFVVIQAAPYDKKADQQYAFKVYDGNLNNLSNSSIELPYKDKNTSIYNYYLSNKGNVYMLLRVEFEKDQKQKGEDKKFFSVLSLNSSTDNSLSEYVVQLSHKGIVSIDIQIDNENNHISCAGFYSDFKGSQTVAKDIDGVFYLNIDVDTQKVLSENYKPIDKKMIAQLLGKKEGAKIKDTKGISTTFRINDFVKLPDGSSYVIAENFRIVEKTVCNKYGCITTYTYHYNNIFAIGISKEGTIQTLTDIPKAQISSYSATAFFSYLVMQKDDKVFLLFNDNIKNLQNNAKTIRDVKSLTSENKASLILTELKPNGQYTKQELFSNNKSKIAAKVVSGFRLSEGCYVVPVVGKGSALGFIRIDLK